MKKTILILLLTNNFISLLAQKPMQYIKTKASISGIASVTKSIAPHTKATLLANTSFKLVEGKIYKGQLPLLSFSTDDKGNFYFELSKGDYCIVEENRPETFTLKKSTKKEKWDNRCRKKQWQQPLFVLNVKTTDNINIEINKHSPSYNPCLQKIIPNGK
jgi:hypothetical protein